MFDKEALAARERQWARFREWEAAHRPTELDIEAAWDWYQAAWELAWEAGTISHTAELDTEKVRRIQEMRARLARLPWPS